MKIDVVEYCLSSLFIDSLMIWQFNPWKELSEGNVLSEIL